MPKKHLAAIIFYSILVSFVVSSSIILALHRSLPKKEIEKTTEDFKETVTIDEKAERFAAVLIGHGGAEHSGGGLADSITLAVVDTAKKQVTLIAIPRDTYINNQKINDVFATDGGDGMKKALAEITGIQPDFYISADFIRFKAIVTALGGLTVDVPVTFDDYFYPVQGREQLLCGKTGEETTALTATMSGFLLEKQFECRYEKLSFTKGPTKMDSDTAIKYVRSRHSETYGSDFARGERAQSVLIAMKNALISLDGIKNYKKIYEEVKGFVGTDLKLANIGQLIGLISDYEDYKIINLNITDKNYLDDGFNSKGQYILTPKSGNWNEIRNYIKTNL